MSISSTSIGHKPVFVLDGVMVPVWRRGEFPVKEEKEYSHHTGDFA